MPIITLTTDFGTRDAYVASMKGRILSRCPEAQLVDVTHEIAPQDVMQAAFVLREAARDFPPGTIHLVVVDPGVGTERRALAVEHTLEGARPEPGVGGDTRQRFVGPDNGVIPLIVGTSEPKRAVVLDQPRHWRGPRISSTFHGRDVFAPVAASLAAGAELEAVGTPAGSLRSLHWVQPVASEEGISGWIAHVDAFGNAITNVPASVFAECRGGRSFKGYAGGATVRSLARTYGEAEPGDAVLLEGSHGFVEIAVRNGNAAELLSIRPGTPVHFVFKG